MARLGLRRDRRSPSLTNQADIAVAVCSGTECPLISSKYVENWGIEDLSVMSLDKAREVVSEIEVKVDDLRDRIARGVVPS